MNIPFNEGISTFSKDVFEYPQKLDKELQSHEKKHEIERGKIEEELRKKRAQFEV
jgi:dynein heavy chain